MLYTIGDLGKNIPDGDYELISGKIPPAPSYYLVNPRGKKAENTHITLCFLNDRLIGADTLGELKCIRTVQEGVENHEPKAVFLNKMKSYGISFEA